MTYTLRINGVTVANPAQDGIKIVDEPVWAEGAGRNVSTGEMIATLVCWKRQVEITWTSLTVSQARTILNAIKTGGSFFWLEYNDIDENQFVNNNTAGLPNTGGEYAKIKVYVGSVPRSISTLANLNNTSVRRINSVTIVFTEK